MACPYRGFFHTFCCLGTGRNPSPDLRRLVKTPPQVTLSPRERAVDLVSALQPGRIYGHRWTQGSQDLVHRACSLGLKKLAYNALG
jgi:hypothetical protein